ncbi:MAG: phosphoribosylaminoimidazolesuccinocarboxamide synthase [Helicobacteraceae bacterium]|nr:phosphoribosylaminoimidazolesuccinocarboxamide synthase [Helicobacteraceae bacterium]
MEKIEVIYEGKAKKLWSTKDKDRLIVEFKDDLTAFNAQKKSREAGKGALNCEISASLFELLARNGVRTHLIERINATHQLVKRVDIIKIEVVIRNIATGSLTGRLGIKEGTKLPFALVELYYKDDRLEDPIVNDEHALIMNLATQNEINALKDIGRRINGVLSAFFADRGLTLIDFKVEFGRGGHGEILLSDEISPDSCRFWDTNSGEKLDKDRFRQDLGGVKLAYEEVLKRIKDKR